MSNDETPGSPPPSRTRKRSNVLAADFTAADETPGGWRTTLVRSDKGLVLPVLENVVTILLNDERWRGVIAYDEFAGRVMKLKPPPFDRSDAGEWLDIDDAHLDLWLSQQHQLRKASTETIVKGVLLAADAQRFHEVRAYLEKLTWDGKRRLAAWLWAYLGAKPPPKGAEPGSTYVEKVAVKWMVGAVARVYQPGCKMDNVLILEGPQDAGKSSALKILFDPWFTDAAFEIGSTDGYQIMRGMWCVELAELDGFNRAEASRSKAFFTRTNDRYRNPYGRKPVNVPRQGVFAGSVNHATYLKDDTGNRRYWPVAVGEIGLEELRADRDQLWAEAHARYRDGVEWWVRASERSLYEGEQEERYIGDAYETKIMNFLVSPDNAGTLPDHLTTAELLSRGLNLDTSKWTPGEQARVGRIMSRIARNPADPSRPFWERRKLGARGARDWKWVRTGVEPAAEGGDG